MPQTAPRIHIRAMTSGDVPAARDLLEQLGYPLTVAEVARRFAAVAAAGDHAAMIAEARGRMLPIHAISLAWAEARR
jgi:hypothetical protein